MGSENGTLTDKPSSIVPGNSRGIRLMILITSSSNNLSGDLVLIFSINPHSFIIKLIQTTP